MFGKELFLLTVRVSCKRYEFVFVCAFSPFGFDGGNCHAEKIFRNTVEEKTGLMYGISFGFRFSQFLKYIYLFNLSPPVLYMLEY